MAVHKQQVKGGLLPVAQHQVLADGGAQVFLNGHTVLDGIGGVVVHPVIGDAQLVQQVIAGQLLGDASGGVGGTAGIASGIDLHGQTFLSRKKGQWRTTALS